MLDRWGWSWRRAHKRRRLDVDPEKAILFVFHILYLLADGIEPADIVDADETAFLRYPLGFYTWAMGERQAVQIHVAGNEKQSYTVMAAVTMEGRKLPLFTIVRGKAALAERGLEQDHQGPHASTHSTTGRMIVAAMLDWLQFLRNLSGFQHGPLIQLTVDGFATHRCDDVLAVADELGIVLHFIPPGLTDLLQPLDRSVFGALKAEYRAIYRMDMSQREGRRMTKADFAAHLIPAWELVSDEAVRRGWECFDPDTRALQHAVCSVSLPHVLWWWVLG
jgi:hypothetical protein